MKNVIKICIKLVVKADALPQFHGASLVTAVNKNKITTESLRWFTPINLAINLNHIMHPHCFPLRNRFGGESKL